MAVPGDTPGASDSGLPTVEAEAIDGATGDPFEIAQAAFNAQPPDDETPEADASDSEPVAADSADDADTTATTEDDADLAQYPEAVRDQFRALPSETRKALKEYAEATAREGLVAVQAREAAIEEAAAAKAKLQADIRAKIGKFVGDEPITKIGRDGIERVLPSFEETQRLNQNRRGRDELWQKYSLDEDGIEDHLENLIERREMLDGSTDILRDRALFQIDQEMRAGFREVGVEDVVVNGARSPNEIVPFVVRHLRAQFEAEKAEIKTEYEGRLEAAALNAEGLRGRALAGSTRALATGGRSTGGSNGKVTVQQLIDEAGGVEAYAERAMRGDYAGLNLRD